MKPSAKPISHKPLANQSIPEGYSRIQPNRMFDSEQEIRDYAFARGARIEKIWKPDLYCCILIMVTPKSK